MMHPDTRLSFVSEAQGLGVFATAFLPRGTLTWVRDPWDIVVTEVPTDLRRNVEHFGYTEQDGTTLICWDHARYVNHSCRANAGSLIAGIDIALRDIQPGEQITNDYGTLGTFEKFPCSCGEPTCRKEVAPRPVDAERVEAFEAARALLGTVPQPLGKRAHRWLSAEEGHGARQHAPGKMPRYSGRLFLR